MRKCSKAIIGSMLLFGSQVFAATEGCVERWEYKMVHLQVADKPMVESAQVLDSAAAFEATLNRLGYQGWELASANNVVMRRIRLEDRGPVTWRAQFDPATALFKRKATVCQ